jgi:anti-sigma factor RsiW
MNECMAMQAKFTEYLDGRLSGREMQSVAAHLEHCRECAAKWKSVQQTQSSLAALGPVPEPEDLPLRIRVAISQERARRLQSPSMHGIWPGRTPSVPSCCRPRVVLPQRCC